MISKGYRNILYILLLIGIIMLLTMPDVLIGLLFETVHFFFELLFHLADITFEWIETLLDKIVETSFHTELHETQIIVFYLMVGIVAITLFYFGRMLLRFFFQLTEASHAVWTQNKIRIVFYWQNLSLVGKIRFIVIIIGAVYLASFLFM